MDKIEFVNLLKKQNIELTDQMISQFDMYFNLIVKYNKVMDLTAVSDDQIYERHFYNSLSIAFNDNFNIHADRKSLFRMIYS